MTIVVGVTSPEGIVLAADSRCTGGNRVVSDSVQKLSPISSKAAVAHYGFAQIGGSSIEALIAEFKTQLTMDELDSVRLPDALGAFLNKRLMSAFTEDELDEITDDSPSTTATTRDSSSPTTTAMALGGSTSSLFPARTSPPITVSTPPNLDLLRAAIVTS